MRTGNRIAVNAISRWMGLVVSAVVAIAVVPIMLAQFGKDGLGLVGICTAILSMRALIDFGLQAAITRQLATANANKDHDQYNNLVNSALAVYLSLGCLVAFGCWMLAPFLATGLKIPSHLYEQGIFLIRSYAGPSFFLVLLTAPVASVLTSNNRFDILNYIETTTQIVRGVGVLLALTMTPWGLYGWAGAQVFASLLHLALVAFFSLKLVPTLSFRLRFVKLGTLPLATSTHTFLLSVSQEISTASDSFVLSALIGPGAVGLYQPGMLLSRRVRPLVDAIKNQLHPLATERSTQGKLDQVRLILIEGTKYRLLMGIGACVGLGIYAPNLAQAWLGDKLNEGDLKMVVTVMILWAVADLFTYAGGSQWPVLFGLNEFPFLVRLYLPLAFLNISTSVLLVMYSPLGISGVIVPTIFCEAFRVGVTSRYCCRRLSIRGLDYFREAYLRPLIVLFILSAFAEGSRRLISPTTIPDLAFCAIINVSFWAVLCFWIGMGKKDRDRFLEMTNVILRKIPIIQPVK